MIMHNLFPQGTRSIPQIWTALAESLTGVLGFAPILAGGALRDHYHDRPVKDLDFFVPHTAEAEAAIREFFAGWEKGQEIGLSCEGLNEVCAVLGYYDHTGQLPDVNVIFLDPEVAFDLEAVAGRCDFGICQIAAVYQGHGMWVVDYSMAFAEDVSSQTFTLLRKGDEDRSMRRWDRLREKYPEHRLVVG